ncbi:hypothetical protein K469DRAFT_570059, partial [Zopfia rhizophila CBS 207.26]
ILREYLNVFIIVYFNNILEYINRTLEEYYKLFINLKKYIFTANKIKFLEFIIHSNSIKIDS